MSRPGVTSMIRARPCTEVVITPAWEPVNERASYPRLWMAMASSAMEIRSPAVSSMSSSRPGGSGLTWLARSSSSSVVSPIAETTTTTSSPALRAATMRSATRLIRSALATEDPPYFCTTSATTVHSLPATTLSVPTPPGISAGGACQTPSGYRAGNDAGSGDPTIRPAGPAGAVPPGRAGTRDTPPTRRNEPGTRAADPPTARTHAE